MGEEAKDGTTVESSTTTKDQSTQDTRGASDKGEGNVPWHEDKRWKEFIAEKNTLKEFKELGLSPAEMKDVIQNYRYLDGLVKQAEEEAAKDKSQGEPVDKERAKLIKEARAQLRELAPELDEVEEGKRFRIQLLGSAERRAIRTTRELMEADGHDTSPKDVEEMSEVLADIIKGNQDLLDDYLYDPAGVVKAAWSKHNKRFRDAAERKAAAEKESKKEPLKTLPKTHAPGGGAEHGTKSEEPKDLKEASKLALRMLRGG